MEMHVPATAQTTDFDPDLDQAIEDLRPVYAALSQARLQRKDMAGAELRDLKAVQSRIADLRGEISARARRICVDPYGLLCILQSEADLRARLRRRPSRRQMIKALRDGGDQAAQAVDHWRKESERAARELALAEVRVAAAETALKSYGGAQ